MHKVIIAISATALTLLLAGSGSISKAQSTPSSTTPGTASPPVSAALIKAAEAGLVNGSVYYPGTPEERKALEIASSKYFAAIHTGEAQLRDGRPDDALVSFQAAAAARPDCTHYAQVYMANAYVDKGDYQTAATLFRAGMYSASAMPGLALGDYGQSIDWFIFADALLRTNQTSDATDVYNIGVRAFNELESGLKLPFAGGGDADVPISLAQTVAMRDICAAKRDALDYPLLARRECLGALEAAPESAAIQFYAAEYFRDRFDPQEAAGAIVKAESLAAADDTPTGEAVKDACRTFVSGYGQFMHMSNPTTTVASGTP